MYDCIEILTLDDFDMINEVDEVVRALADKSEDDFEIDQSTQFFLGRMDDYKSTLRYRVNDDDSFSIEMGVRNADKDVVWTTLDKQDALSMAIELIAYAHKIDELNDPNI